MSSNGFDLTGWPFATVPTPERAKIWAGRPEVKKQCIDLLRGWNRRPDSDIALYWAEWGQGKSHTLFYIRGQIPENGTDVVHYVQLPSLTGGSSPFKALYEQLMLDFPLDNLSERVFDKFQSNPTALFGPVAGSPLQRIVCQVLWILKTNTPGRAAAERWIRGQRVTQKELSNLVIAGRTLQIPPALRNAQDCQNLLGAVINMVINFPTPRYGKCILLVDEFQRIGSLNVRKMEEVCSSLHLVFNTNPEGFRLVLAFATGDPESLSDSLAGELMSRVTHKIGLPNPTLDEVILYVKELLQAYYPDHHKNPDFYPFEMEAAHSLAKYVYDASAPYCTLRKINLVFNRSFDWILNEREDQGINGSNALVTLTEVIDAKKALDSEIRQLLTNDMPED